MSSSVEAWVDVPAGSLKPAGWWVDHFHENVRRDWQIPWEVSVTMSATTRARVAKSIAEFQRGESSEATHYLEKSREFSIARNDAAFHDASILFVREENGHAALLGRFMKRAGLPMKKKCFSDGVFRWLRAFSDLGWSSRVLIIAELVAQEYYPCLQAATGDLALRRICDKIIYDEEAHIRFQVERIVHLEAGRSERDVRRRAAWQAVIMFGAAYVVWCGHWRVLRARLTRAEFVRAVLARNRRAIAAMRELRMRASR